MYAIAMARAASSTAQSGHEFGIGLDGLLEFGEVAAERCEFVRIAGAGRSHWVFIENRLGSCPGCTRDIVADELEGIEHRTESRDKFTEWLIPAKRMSRHDRRLVAADDSKQFGEADTRGNVFERRQAVNQKVAFKGRDLHTRKNAQGCSLGRQVRELVGHPLVVMLGDHQAVEAKVASMVDQPDGVDDAVGGVPLGVQVVINFHGVAHFGRELLARGSRCGCASPAGRHSPAAMVTSG
jgi:hypothetical protein